VAGSTIQSADARIHFFPNFSPNFSLNFFLKQKTSSLDQPRNGSSREFNVDAAIIDKAHRV
jgi:hypothetical protein